MFSGRREREHYKKNGLLVGSGKNEVILIYHAPEIIRFPKGSSLQDNLAIVMVTSDKKTFSIP